LKILLAHNFYQTGSPSGEDIVFRNEKLLLEHAGHEVIAFEKHSDTISGIVAKTRAALDTHWSSDSYRELRQLIGRRRPDVAHFHNTFPLISPSAYRACHDEGVPTVQTLHNYRLICPGALLMRDGRPCEDCVGGSMLPAIQYGCYRQSRTATAIVVSMLAVHRARKTYANDVDRYIALTQLAKERLVRGGLPESRIAVRPNGLTQNPSVGNGAGGYALYVGRLSAEKGVRTLIEAWRDIDFPLRIVGDGALRPQLETQSRDMRVPATFLGFQPRSEVIELMRGAAFLVIPSEWYEGFPVTLLEAFATGTPLVVSAIGALDELVTSEQHGLKFTAGDAASLRASAVRLLADEPLRVTMRHANRRLFEELYSREPSLASLLSIYEEVILARGNSPRPSAAVAGGARAAATTGLQRC